MKTVVIIGGGLAGLSSAISLAHKGFKVKLFEKNAHFGGKMRRYQLGTASLISWTKYDHDARSI